MLAASLSLEKWVPAQIPMRSSRPLSELEFGNRTHRAAVCGFSFPLKESLSRWSPMCCLFPCEEEAGCGLGSVELEGVWQGESGGTHKWHFVRWKIPTSFNNFLKSAFVLENISSLIFIHEDFCFWRLWGAAVLGLREFTPLQRQHFIYSVQPGASSRNISSLGWVGLQFQQD